MKRPKKQVMADDVPMPKDEMPSNRALESTLAPERSPFPRKKPRRIEDLGEDGGAVERGNRASRREAEDLGMAKRFAKGGMVRGTKAQQVSGKGFKGTF